MFCRQFIPLVGLMFAPTWAVKSCHKKKPKTALAMGLWALVYTLRKLWIGPRDAHILRNAVVE